LDFFFEGNSIADQMAMQEYRRPFFFFLFYSSYYLAFILFLFFENVIGICDISDIMSEPMTFDSGGVGVAGICHAALFSYFGSFFFMNHLAAGM